MTKKAAERRTCSIDKDARKMDWVAARHLEGKSFLQMEKMSEAADAVPKMKRETMARHIRECIGISANRSEVMKAAAEVREAGEASKSDVASLVQEQVVEKLEAGEARVTVQHGLQAQQLLDRRAERAKDRELAVTLARLLHTAAPPEDAIRHRLVDGEDGEQVIEGEVVRVG